MIVKNKQQEVLLTFDDGPTRYLPEILSVLQKEHVQGLFFWQSRLVHRKRPWKQVLQDGHSIGTHGHSHRMLTKLSYEQQLRQLLISTQQIEPLIGQKMKWFRPPFGLYNENTMKAAQHLDLEMVLWQIASWDWVHQTDEDQILENVLGNVKAGDLVLLHELPQTLRILPQLIQGIRQKGLKLANPQTHLRLQGLDQQRSVSQ